MGKVCDVNLSSCCGRVLCLSPIGRPERRRFASTIKGKRGGREKFSNTSSAQRVGVVRTVENDN